MADSQIGLGELHALVMAELGTGDVQKIDAATYRRASALIGRLRGEEYGESGPDARLKESALRLASELAVMLVTLRLAKGAEPGRPDYANLLDEEKGARHYEEEAVDARGAVVSAVLGGKPRQLELVSAQHRRRLAVVVMLEPADALTGTDLKSYGPYRAYDIACLPVENAVVLASKGAAMRLRWADFARDA